MRASALRLRHAALRHTRGIPRRAARGVNLLALATLLAGTGARCGAYGLGWGGVGGQCAVLARTRAVCGRPLVPGDWSHHVISV